MSRTQKKHSSKRVAEKDKRARSSNPLGRNRQEISHSRLDGLPCSTTARSGLSNKLDRARSRLYRGQILQETLRLKALAEIYTMHSFAPLLESICEKWTPLHRSPILIFSSKIIADNFALYKSCKFCLNFAEFC